MSGDDLETGFVGMLCVLLGVLAVVGTICLIVLMIAGTANWVADL